MRPSVRDAHRRQAEAACLKLAAIDPAVRGANQPPLRDSLAVFEEEWPIFRAAFEWAAGETDRDDANDLLDRLTMAAAHLLGVRRRPEESILWAHHGALAAKRLGDRARHARHLVHLARAYGRTGDHDMAVPAADEAAHIARDACADTVVIEALGAVAELLLIADMPDQSFAWATRMLELAEEHHGSIPNVTLLAARATRAEACVRLDEPELIGLAIRDGYGASTFARLLGDDATSAVALSTLGAAIAARDGFAWRAFGRWHIWRAHRRPVARTDPIVATRIALAQTLALGRRNAKEMLTAALERAQREGIADTELPLLEELLKLDDEIDPSAGKRKAMLASLAAARLRDDRRLEAHRLAQLAKVEREIDLFSGMAAYSNGLQVAAAIGDPDLTARILCEYADVVGTEGWHQTDLKLFESHLPLMASAAIGRFRHETLRKLAPVYRQFGREEDAKNVASAALTIARELKDDDFEAEDLAAIEEEQMPIFKRGGTIPITVLGTDERAAVVSALQERGVDAADGGQSSAVVPETECVVLMATHDGDHGIDRALIRACAASPRRPALLLVTNDGAWIGDAFSLCSYILTFSRLDPKIYPLSATPEARVLEATTIATHAVEEWQRRRRLG